MAELHRPMSFVATTQPEKAKAFYGNVIGLKLVEHSPYALAFLEGKHLLRVQIVTDFAPASHTVHGWQVTDIADEVKTLNSKGVEFLTFVSLGQDANGVWTSPDGHKIAWFKDPCRNTLSLTEFVQI